MIETLLSKLDKVKRSGRGKWMARCPCHHDKTPSLSIRDNDGTILIFCFGCGAGGVEVCDTLGVDVNDLFPPSDIDYKNYPQRKISISSDQALAGLQQECTVVYIIAKDMMTTGAMDDATRERLLQACERIHAVTVSYK